MPNIANTTALIPVGWGTTVGTTAQLVLPANPTRTGLIWFNPSAVSISIWPASTNIGVLGVFPGFSTTNTIAAGGAGSITIATNAYLIIDNMACSCAWNGIAAASGGSITVLEMQ